MDIKQMKDEAARLLAEARASLTAAEKEGREQSSEEKAKWDRAMADFEKIEARIAAAQKLAKAEQAINDIPDDGHYRRTQPDAANGRKPEQRDAEPQPIKVEFRQGDTNYTINIDPSDERYNANTDEYRRAFAAYLSQSETRELSKDERRTLAAGLAPKGGYTAPATFVARLLEKVKDANTIRGIAMNDFLTEGVSLGYPTLETVGVTNAAWGAELGTIPQGSMTFGKRELQPHKLAARVLVSRDLIDSSAINIESVVQRELAWQLANLENQAFMNGDGAQKPLGVFTASTQGIPTSRDVVTGNATAVTDTGLIKTLYGVKSQYMTNGVWVMHRSVASAIRQIKDAQGDFLWRDGGLGLNGTQPNTLLGRPVYIDEAAPSTFSDGNYALIYGDFSRGYHIATALNLEMQRLNELYAETSKVGFVARHRVDGMPVLAEAFCRLKFATS